MLIADDVYVMYSCEDWATSSWLMSKIVNNINQDRIEIDVDRKSYVATYLMNMVTFTYPMHCIS